MDCAEAKLRIEPYVTGNLSGDEKGSLESHLEACAECRLDAELTRAAHSNPSATAAPPPAPPEPTPAAPSASSWTIDSIFGAPAPGKQAAPAPQSHEVVEPSPAPESAPEPEPGAEAAPAEFGVPRAFATTSAQEDSFENVLADDSEPSHEPESEVELPSALDGPPLPPLSGGPSQDGHDETEEQDETEDHGSTGNGWDFEPADQKDGALPPEGSLFFAEEALGRSKGRRKKKGSFAKVAFWILGGIVGLGLLGVSVWIALAMRGELTEQHPAHDPLPPGQTALPPPAGETAAATELGATKDPSATREGSSNKETSETAPTTDATAEAPTRVANEEGRRSSPAPPKTSGPQKTATPTKTAQSLAAEKTARELAALPTPWRNPPPRPAPRKPVPVDDGDEFAPRPEKPRVAAVKPSVSMPAKQVETPKAPSAMDSSAMVAIERTLAPPATEPPAPSTAKTTPPAAETTAPPRTESAPEAPRRPLDQLHLATLEAEQSADVPSLRKLRDTWRSLVRNSIGPDRARAKRELADCLWAIQTLTTRTSDQKAALAAYRDYVLNAPAGGADPRTVARMRQLEDALTESH
jgi:hypothetical protein